MERSPWLKVLTILLVVIAALYLFERGWALAERFADIILLFFLAWLLAFVLKPIARLLRDSVGIPWPLSVGLVYLGLFLVLVLVAVVLVPVVAIQLAQLGTNLPTWAEALPSAIDPVQSALSARGVDVNLERWYQNQDLPVQIERLGTLLIQNTLTLLTGIASTVFAAIVVLILSFYLLLDGDHIAREVIALVPSRLQDEVSFLFESIDRTFGGFLRGQLFQAIIYGAGTALVMYVAGLGYILSVSLFAGLMMFIPFFGPFLALVPPLLVGLFHLAVGETILMLIALLALQQIVLNILAPKIMSDSVGIHPLLVFLAILGGAKMAGLAGAVFGVPIAGVINAMLWYFYRQSDVYRRRMERAQPTLSTHPADSSPADEGWRAWGSRLLRGITGAMARILLRDSKHVNP